MENANKIKELIKKMKAQKEPSEEALSILKDIKTTLVQLLTEMQLSRLQKLVSEVKAEAPKEQPKSDLSRKEALDNLESIATNKKDVDGKRTFLLYRATEDYEYEKSIRENKQYENLKESIWFAEYLPAEDQKMGPNPVVGCWIPEDGIKNIPNPHSPEAGTFGSLGRNPFASRYQAEVSPGVYELHLEYKGK